MSRVSVIIPTCGRPALLASAIRSVLGQSFQDFEIIVIDDGQDIKSETVVKELGDERIRYMSNPQKLGGAATRNRGIKEAGSPLIAFLDDDDEWLPEKLETQVTRLADTSPQLGFCFSAVKNIYDNREEVTQVEEGVRDYHEIALTRFKGFLTSSLLVKKEVFEKVGGFDESFPSHQEAELILRITEHYQGLGINKPLVLMNAQTSHEHIGSSFSRKIAGREKILSKYLEEYKKRPSMLSRQYFYLALMCREGGELEKASLYFKKSWQAKFNLRSFAHYLNVTLKSKGRKFKRNILSWKIFRPQHFGTLMRGNYFDYYFKKSPLKDLKPEKVFDAGCGRGQYTEKLAKFYSQAEVVGGDVILAPEWEDYRLPNLKFELIDLRNWQAEKRFDMVVSIDTLEHIENNEKVIEKISRSLKDGGYFYFAVPCEETEFRLFPRSWFKQFHDWEEDEHVGEQYPLNELKTKVEAAGFKILTSRHTFTFWGTLGWEIEFLLRGKKLGNKLNLLLMPFYRFLAFLDLHLPLGSGNNLIIAVKN